MKSKVETYYNDLCSKCSDMKKYKFEDFRRCLLMVYSRAFNLTFDGDKEMCMVPYIDMVNYTNPRACESDFDLTS